MTYETLLFEEKGAVGTLTLNRPAVINAMNRKMIEELEDFYRWIERHPACRVLILTGAGDRGFCAGLDMQEALSSMFEASAEDIYKLQSRTSRLIYRMRQIPQPIIAAVHGAASGGGFSFAMAADVRIITPKAKFNAAYINIGLGGADLASSYFLPKLIGSGRANEFLLTGDFMTASEAVALGFASRMVPQPQLMETAIEIAEKMVGKDPMGLIMTKEAINQNLDAGSLEHVLHMENRNQSFLIAAMKLKALQQES
jgi:enoyl-CoA hydratase/carnithine racemase